jgi:hypothetical protein
VGALTDTHGDVPFLRFSPDAQNRWDQWIIWWNNRFRQDSELPAIAAHLVKYRKLVPALALVFHLSQWAGGHRPSGSVGRDSLDLAIRWADYLEAHARRIYAVDPGSETTEAATLLLHKIKAGELVDGFTVRDTYRRCWSGLSTKARVEAAIAALCGAHFLRRVEGKTITYRLNPRITIAPVPVSALPPPPPPVSATPAPPLALESESVPF